MRRLKEIFLDFPEIFFFFKDFKEAVVTTVI